ncbi:hypothetical protein [Mycolicibacterium sp. XJ1819]
MTAPYLADVQDLMAMHLHLMSEGRASVTFPPTLVQEITEIFSEAL